MLWIMLPVTAIDLVCLVVVGLVKVSLVKIVLDVLVIVVHVLVIHINVDVTTAPSAVPTPASTPGCSQGNSGSECNGCPSCVISRRRISNRRIRINGRAVNYGWIVRGNINNVGIGLLHHDNLFISAGCAHRLCLNSLLSCRF
jgi:hypothetical protein